MKRQAPLSSPETADRPAACDRQRAKDEDTGDERRGYAATTADQQQKVLGNIRIKTAMRKALEKAGVTQDLLGHKIREGLDAKNGSGKPKHHARHKFVVTASELHAAFPAKKLEHKIENSVSYKDSEQPAKARANTPDEARRLAGAGQ